MKRTLLFRMFLLLGLFLAVSLAVGISLNPLRWPDRKLRGWLLEKTPHGATSEEVRAVAKKHGWFDPWRQRADGMTYGPYIRGQLGKYWSGPVRVYVSAIWEFNSSNQLAHVRIWKTVAMP
jgi:hypothetical protein